MKTRIFKLSSKNPIISPLDLPFQAAAVLNPGDTERGDNVVLQTGLLLRGDELWMYYGAADTCTCLATAKLDHVLAMLEK
jgi:hypothetical protein